MISFSVNWLAYRFNVYQLQEVWHNKFSANFTALNQFQAPQIISPYFPNIYTYYAQLLYILEKLLNVYADWSDVESLVEHILKR